MGRRKIRPDGMSQKEYQNMKSETYAKNTREGLYAFQGLYGRIFRQYAPQIARMLQESDPALLATLNTYEHTYQKVKDYGKHK